MDTYYITSSTVSVRVGPGSDYKIINVLKPGTVVRTVEDKNGWLKTISGRYILKTQYIELLDKYNKRMLRDGKKDEVIQIARINPTVTRISTMSNSNSGISTYATTDQLNDYVGSARVSSGTKDINGTVLPADDENTIYTIVKGSYDEGNGTIKLSSTSNSGTTEYTVNLADIQIKDSDSNQWETVQPSEDSVHKQQINSIIDLIKATRSRNTMLNINLADLNISNTRSVYGMPYQFSSIVDNRLDGSFNNISFGRKYAEKIVARMPMMVIQAGVPEFLQGYNDDDKTAISEAIMNTFNIGKDDSDLSNIVNESGRYYALKVTPTEYYDCVTPMCRAAGMLLGLGDKEIIINGVKDKVSNFNWMDVARNPVWGYYQGAVSFYINSDAQIQESFSNGTTQSQLASRVNQLGALGQEVQFLLGGVTNATGFDLASFGKESLGSDGKSNFSNANGVIDNLIANAKTLIAGGRMIFPEIWSDSQFMRSYQVTIKLDSPDCDNLSLYLNIFVPLCHILGFVQPRRVGSNVYISPFLVRAYYKSMFHIDMGIITECNITKGDVGAWNQNGLPTQVTVQLTIKDLYNVLSMSTNHGTNDLIGNPAQLDYIANMCGVNIAEPDIVRNLKLWWLIRGTNRVEDNLHSAWTGAMNSIYGRLYNLTSWGSGWTM